MKNEIIRESLDYGLTRIKPETLDRLQKSRREALSHYSDKKTVLGFVLAGHGETHHEHHHPKIGVWLPALALILGIAAITYWKSTEQNAQDNSDVDAAILSDDLPVPAFTDKHFDSWLRHSQP